MSIQMSLVFALTTLEMVIVGLLLLPLPPKLQTVLISNYDKLISNPNISIILSFIDVLIGIMFVDAFKNGFGMIGKEDEVIEYSKNLWETRSRKFYSQRNMYILGAVLSFQVCIWFIMMLLKSTVKHNDLLSGKIAQREGDKAANEKPDPELAERARVLELDVETLKKQYDQLWAEYSKKNTDTTKADDKDDKETKKDL